MDWKKKKPSRRRAEREVCDVADRLSDGRVKLEGRNERDAEILKTLRTFRHGAGNAMANNLRGRVPQDVELVIGGLAVELLYELAVAALHQFLGDALGK